VASDNMLNGHILCYSLVSLVLVGLFFFTVGRTEGTSVIAFCDWRIFKAAGLLSLLPIIMIGIEEGGR